MTQKTLKVNNVSVPLTWVHTLVIGSGAAGLNAAVQLHNQGVEDILVISEGLKMGTSINTGSDKQTYYKLNLCGGEADSPRQMAETYFAGGSMHGDLALVEASLSARAFVNLVGLGVPFPQDAFGQFVGYKTDHDPRRRATSVGPYTSREMCRALIGEVVRRAIRVLEKRNAVALLTVGEKQDRRAAGAVVMDVDGALHVYGAENVVFAVGGPGGLYRTSVYPIVQTGAIGLALMAGARAQSLSESQYGMSSIKFRWNVSGSFMQVMPRFVSTDEGGGDEREFLNAYFKSPGHMNSMIFLKGYQWPFDPRKIVGGSSIVDVLVYVETVIKGRRVFLDFQSNSTGFAHKTLSGEARDYLKNSRALQDSPIERLRAMNPKAIDLYGDHGIDIRKELLEIAVCAQHNNGGLAANHWWESLNVKHLFPVGEVNGSHGVYRPGGSALNAGQVGSLRAADFIAHRYAHWTLDRKAAEAAAAEVLTDVLAFMSACPDAPASWQTERDAFQQRMTRAGAHVRSAKALKKAVTEAREQWQRLSDQGCNAGGRSSARGLIEALRTRQLCFAHLVYLEAVHFAVKSSVGSRGSAVVLDPEGKRVHPRLGKEWRFQKEKKRYRDKVLETEARNGKVRNKWVDRRPIPDSDLWFETAWATYRQGGIFE
jgi:succinate dehydrogenase/fumarate reductase flavoprotein subunit